MVFGFGIKKRRLSNLLLQPMLQTQIGLYCIGLSFIFAMMTAIVIYQNLGSLFDIMYQLSDGKITLQSVGTAYLENIQVWVFACLAGYVASTVGVSILYTHRLVGPTIAFRRHLDAIENGDFSHKTVLRKNDAFQEVATRLNELSAFLDSKKEIVKEIEKQKDGHH